MAWYKAGTVAVTNGSATVTGTGTSWFGALQSGWGFVGPDGRTYEIETVNAAGSLTLATNYQGASASGQDYSAFPTNALEYTLATAIQTLIDDFQSVADGPGEGKFPNGTETAPGIAFTSDTDVGIARLEPNKIGLVANGLQLGLKGGVADGAAVQSDPSDTTTGKILLTGAFGLGGAGAQVVSDFDNADRSGYYAISSLAAASNAPDGWNSGPAAIHVSGSLNGNNLTQYAVALNGGGKIAVRQYRASNWSDWSIVYTSNNILDAVAQDGGVPTGGIIESGSNANGHYTRWADGTQMCQMTGFATNSGTAATWTFPAAFSAQPAVTATSENASEPRIISVVPGSSSAAVYSWDEAGVNTVSPNVQLIAFGRWF